MIINLTQHPATPDQVAAGVTEPPDKAAVQGLLTFDGITDTDDILDRAGELAAIAREATAGDPMPQALIGGALYLMGPLEQALRRRGVRPVYSFSIRTSTETMQPDGSVKKTQVFRHAGFVEGQTHEEDAAEGCEAPGSVTESQMPARSAS